MKKLLPVLLACLLAPTAGAELVVPTDAVKRRVVVRESPDRSGRDVGSLRPGDRSEHLEDFPRWRRIRLEDGTLGFVSAKWTRVVAGSLAPEPESATPTVAPPPRKRRTAVQRFFDGFSSSPAVEFVIRDPEPDARTYRNTDPNLPVSGFARMLGSANRYDLILAIDVSGSTNEHAHVDVDDDGRADAGWKGKDSIFHAEIEAARSLVDTLERMPRNPNGERIRIGIVSYSGDERYRLARTEKKARLDRERLHELAQRDSKLWLPLTGDYDAARQTLKELSSFGPFGMTDIAAGVGRALIELGGRAAEGARSQPRDDAEKVVLLLTDGKPSLPYDRDQAERAASLAGKLASEMNVRVNAFALGRNAVTRADNDAVKRMAKRTGGGHVVLENPADIVSVLDTTPFSTVEEVRIRNQTTGDETSYIATGIDGSFYGEIPLVEGENTIEIAARLDDDRLTTQTFRIEYVDKPPVEELAARLKHLKIENEALIEKIKDRLAREMARKRKLQERGLEIEAEESDGPWPAAGAED